MKAIVIVTMARPDVLKLEEIEKPTPHTRSRHGQCSICKSCRGRTIFIADAHRGYGKRFIIRAEEILTAFVELERAIHAFAVELTLRDSFSG